MSTPQYAPPPQTGPQPYYPPYMHPFPRQPSGIGSFLSPMIVVVGICVGVLLIFIGIIIFGFVNAGAGLILKVLGAGGGFLTAGGGAYLGREFTRDQRLGLYIVAAAFLIGMASI